MANKELGVYAVFAALLLLVASMLILFNQQGPAERQDLVEPSELVRGAPRGGIGVPGGIPSLINPRFGGGEWLGDEDLVLGLVHNGEVKAYPLRIMSWHEIVNDVAGGEPVLVTYCPLCRTGVAFHRTINGEVTDFGTSGYLLNGNLVMYDSLTESYWSQVTGQAITGPMAGTTLERINVFVAPWGRWHSAFPQTLVLSRDTGFDRDYSYDPYGGWSTERGIGFGVTFDDDQLHPKEIVYGVNIGNSSKAYWEKHVMNASPILDELDGQHIAVYWDKGLETARIFAVDDGFDASRIVEYRELESFGLYWFAWIGFNPNTVLVKGD